MKRHRLRRHRRRRPVPPPVFDLWSKQREIIRSAWDNPWTAVPSMHSAGKTHAAACLCVTWVMDPAHPAHETSVVVLAPTHKQIVQGVFRHLRRLASANTIPGKIIGGNAPVWRLEGHDVAIGHSPPKGDTTGVQGIHDRFLLVIADEACGVEEGQWDAMMSLATGDENRIVAIGNPTDRETRFGAACEVPDSQWNVIRVPVSCSPHFTGEEVSPAIAKALPSREHIARLRKEWSPAEQAARLDAVFPNAALLAIFGPESLPTQTGTPPVKAHVAGVDVAGEGRDRSAAFVHNTDERLIWEVPIPSEVQHGSLPALAKFLGRKFAALGVEQVAVDGLGPGAELVLPLQAALPDAQVVPIMVGARAHDFRTYFNFKAELHWMWAKDPPTLLNPSGIVLKEFKSVRQDLNETRRKVERKADLIARLDNRSPDSMDAALLANFRPPSMKSFVL